MAFRNPTEFASGIWRVSWNSLQTVAYPQEGIENDRYCSRNCVTNVDNVSASSLVEALSVIYELDGTITVEDGSGVHSLGGFEPNVSDHFDLCLVLDSQDYRLAVDAVEEMANGSFIDNGVPVEFFSTVFGSLGRGAEVALPPFAIDDIRVQAVPEPSTIAIWSLLGLVGLGCGWRKWKAA
jgi:hypothetical protein